MTVVPEAMLKLRQEHANMTMLLDVLEQQIARLRQGEVADFRAVKGILDYFLTYPDLVHHPKEDLLYHRMCEVDPEATAAADALLSGHEHLGILTRRVVRAAVDHMLRESKETRIWFISLGQDFVDMNRRHLAEEEQHFFPLALRVLSPSDWAEIDAQISSEDDPLFGDKVDTRFQMLHERFLTSERDRRTLN
jgi:hemerythrin-like domain-containing protein